MWNDKETDLDLLGHQRVAQTIVEIMREEELRPLTVGIHGSWGAGKTSILSLIETELKSDTQTLCFTFNGWLYQGYEDTKSALMEAVVHELLKTRSTNDKMLDLGKSILRRINWLKVAKVGGSLAMTAALGLPATALFGVPGLMAGAKSLFSKKDEASPDVNVEVQAEEDPWLKPEEATVPAQIEAFRKELQQLIKESTVERLVVLVDDLDRCLPSAVIDILEAVKLFLFIEGTVFVIAADEQMIEYAVRRHFPDLPVSQADYTKHYLEKLIQVPIRVPSLNKLQTQNYIRFMLLQNHLEYDKDRLIEICHAFESSRETPYDNTELSYEFIAKQFGGENQDLRGTLAVAEQLGNTLANELRGNPRNIKRFLNTLFLRKRVAKIYGLETKVAMDVLAKLMLLERFHSEVYEKVVMDATESDKGTSSTIKQLEETDKAKDTSGKKKETKIAVKATEKPINSNLREWAKQAPSLTEVDLRPYVFISRDRAVSFRVADDLPPALAPIFEALASGIRLTFVKYESEIKALGDSLARLLFDKLKTLTVKEGDWKNMPKPMEGLTYLVQRQASLEVPLVDLLNSVAPKDLGAWLPTRIDFFRSSEGKQARRVLFENISQDPNADQTLKALIEELK
ncbi:Qat anti-phage system ATPase QatA [Pontibacter litorisediminis]|uniref:Qat anti-phage system ATPase QatA n=1 Tax=Pontibacter litorisediminis TaxID=1846260 RepID=UPI0023EB1B87|nr:Qat anti-phage system ATPase QatA [Pontibacter litorisediminis]